MQRPMETGTMQCHLRVRLDHDGRARAQQGLHALERSSRDGKVQGCQAAVGPLIHVSVEKHTKFSCT